jgi:hypothetical protein
LFGVNLIVIDFPLISQICSKLSKVIAETYLTLTGNKEGLFTNWTDTLKAWEDLPLLRIEHLHIPLDIFGSVFCLDNVNVIWWTLLQANTGWPSVD